ncbi:hypothetical protein EIP91_006163 [Steccherinum ochraceum]|uniref:WHIM1 domain-containing protein n=1 Tax=Steccherinum ochraceum TaxID=92696 RepID=A0A4R0R655_9APHY|nr:hypothetical protein EIP91_006163 [Steccherinum ochraceum]
MSAVPDVHEKKGHVCPPSNATHPRDRWESLFVYGFICRYTQLKGKVEGLETPMDFEDALLSPEANPIMTQILSRFVLNLRSQTRNLSADVISSTLSTIFQEYFKSNGNERSVFWDEEYRINLDPFQGENANFWGAGWDFKLKVLRQLVELQLCHCQEIKLRIDRAWGVIHNKHKKMEMTSAPPPPEDPNSMENLQLVPLGQDRNRKRYWVIDAEVRETRTRRKAARVDYAYLNDPDTEDDGDDYVYQEDHEPVDDEDFMQDDESVGGRRRSTRSTRASNNGHSSGNEWRGERRSTRLGAPTDMQLDGPPPKRARTVDSTSSGDVQPSASSSGSKSLRPPKVSGAAAVKPTETAVEAIAGKKKSKFWFYAVEPIPGQAAPPAAGSSAIGSAVPDVGMANPSRNGTPSTADDANPPPPSETNTNGDQFEKSVERSLSPSSRMDES